MSIRAFKYGGGAGIRTLGSCDRRFSRPVLSATQSPHRRRQNYTDRIQSDNRDSKKTAKKNAQAVVFSSNFYVLVRFEQKKARSSRAFFKVLI